MSEADRVELSWPQREALASARRIHDIPVKVLARKLGVAPRTLCSWQIGERRPTRLQLACWWREVMGQHLFSGAVENESASGDAGVGGGLLQQDISPDPRAEVGIPRPADENVGTQLQSVSRRPEGIGSRAWHDGEAVADSAPEAGAVF